MTEKTIFEKIIDREIPARIIYEDEKHIAFLDIDPFEKGHSLVVPKHPWVTVFDMPEDAYMELQRIVHKVALHMKDKMDCGLNIHQNNGAIARQEVPHVHFHLIPRLEDKETYHPENHVKYESEQEKDQFLEMLKLG